MQLAPYAFNSRFHLHLEEQMAAALVCEPSLLPRAPAPRSCESRARPGVALRKAGSSSPFFTAHTMRWRTVLNAVPCRGLCTSTQGLRRRGGACACVHVAAVRFPDRRGRMHEQPAKRPVDAGVVAGKKVVRLSGPAPPIKVSMRASV